MQPVTDQDPNIYRQAIMRNPTAPIYNEDGSYNEDFNVNYYYNPVGMLEERLGNYTYEETRATGNVTKRQKERKSSYIRRHTGKKVKWHFLWKNILILRCSMIGVSKMIFCS